MHLIFSAEFAFSKLAIHNTLNPKCTNVTKTLKVNCYTIMVFSIALSVNKLRRSRKEGEGSVLSLEREQSFATAFLT